MNRSDFQDPTLRQLDIFRYSFSIPFSQSLFSVRQVSASSKSKAIVEQLKDYKIKEELLTSRLRIVDEEINRTSVKLASFHKKVTVYHFMFSFLVYETHCVDQIIPHISANVLHFSLRIIIFAF